MARIRTIKPEFPQSESMGRVSRDARLLFVQLWCICDDQGRTRAVSRMLASLLFPYDDDAPTLIGGWLDELEREGCIQRYVVAGAQYLQVCKWQSHQKIDRPSKGLLPPPPNNREDSCGTREDSRGIAKAREGSCEDLDQGRDQGKDQGPGAARAQAQADARDGEGPADREAPTPHGDTCRRLVKLGIPQVNPTHPALLDLLRDGATPDGIEATAAELRARDGRAPGFKLVLATVRGRLEDAAAGITTGRGIRAPPARASIATPLPAPGSYGPSDLPDDWQHPTAQAAP